MAKDWGESFAAFVKSPLGVELIRSLKEDLHQSLVEDAEKSDTQDVAYGLIKEARGVIKSIEHLQFRAVVPKGKGGEGVK